MGLFHISLLELILALLVVSYVIEPFSVLCHEMGHAAAAMRVSTGPVLVEVGCGQRHAVVRLQRLTIKFSPVLYRPGTVYRGICRWSRTGVGPRGRMRVALGGPIATALLVPLYGLGAYLTRSSPAWFEAIFVLSAVACMVSLLFNLDPRQDALMGSIPPKMQKRDGIKAREAFRQSRDPDYRNRRPGPNEWSS